LFYEKRKTSPDRSCKSGKYPSLLEGKARPPNMRKAEGGLSMARELQNSGKIVKTWKKEGNRPKKLAKRGRRDGQRSNGGGSLARQREGLEEEVAGLRGDRVFRDKPTLLGRKRKKSSPYAEDRHCLGGWQKGTQGSVALRRRFDRPRGGTGDGNVRKWRHRYK